MTRRQHFTLTPVILGLALAGWSATTPAVFTDTTAAAGISAPESFGAGWGDYDKDGCADLMVSRVAGLVLYRNNCNGTFTDVTASAGIAGPAGGWAVTWADYDEDGDLDVYIAKEGANVLYQNQGNGTFVDVAAAAGVADTRPSTGAAWADYDQDGDLDLFVANRWFDPVNNPDIRDRLYQNQGDGTFVDVADAVGVAGALDRKSFTGIWFDYDNDGDLDLYITVDFGDDVLYRNNGNGTFTDASATAGITDPQHGMGVSVGDVNFDGCIDITSSNNTQEPDAEHGPSALYINNCDGTFTNRNTELGILDRAVVEWGMNFVDYDNDGDLDLGIVAGGMLSSGEPNVLYENSGCGTFVDATAATGTGHTGPAFGSAWGDYDNDGDLDWFVANVAGNSALLRNDSATGHYLRVKLNGTDSHIDGIGARVELTSGGRTQVRTITAGLSFASSEELVAHFGLGVKDKADKVRVLWPAGSVSEITDVAADQTVQIDEMPAIPVTGHFTGVTRDPGGIPTSAKVELRDPVTNALLATVFSDAAGLYTLPEFALGSYRLRVTKSGYRFGVVDPADLDAAEVTVDLQLRVR